MRKRYNTWKMGLDSRDFAYYKLTCYGVNSFTVNDDKGGV